MKLIPKLGWRRTRAAIMSPIVWRRRAAFILGAVAVGIAAIAFTEGSNFAQLIFRIKLSLEKSFCKNSKNFFGSFQKIFFCCKVYPTFNSDKCDCSLFRRGFYAFLTRALYYLHKTTPNRDSFDKF